MTRGTTIHLMPPLQGLLATLVLILTSIALAHELEETSPEPGFRPDSEHAAAFLEALDTATVGVYPTIVRRASRTACSFASQELIVALLNDDNTLNARAAPNRVDLGRLTGTSQWDLFQNDMQRLGEKVEGWRSDANYHLFMEFLLPVSDQTIFGVQLYILDEDGRNAFSFLLNSHHEAFNDASLFAYNSSESARMKLHERATRLGVSALKSQIEQASAQR